MTTEQIQKLLDQYEQTLAGNGRWQLLHEVPRHSNNWVLRINWWWILWGWWLLRICRPGCLNMIEPLHSFLAEDKLEKLMRWLGFLQGTLWVLGVFSIDELRLHNR